jgi:hypothetical protein
MKDSKHAQIIHPSRQSTQNLDYIASSDLLQNDYDKYENKANISAKILIEERVFLQA